MDETGVVEKFEASAYVDPDTGDILDIIDKDTLSNMPVSDDVKKEIDKAKIGFIQWASENKVGILGRLSAGAAVAFGLLSIHLLTQKKLTA